MLAAQAVKPSPNAAAKGRSAGFGMKIASYVFQRSEVDVANRFVRSVP
jgi:hypothetical protein